MEGKKKLYKSNTDKKVLGVCGGIAEYTGIDSAIIRIIVFVLCLCAFSGLVLYIACGLIIPSKPTPEEERFVDFDAVKFTVNENQDNNQDYDYEEK